MTETPAPQAPAPQPTPPQKKGKGKWFALGCGGCGVIVLLIVVIAIIASIAGGGSSDGSKAEPSSTQEQTSKADDDSRSDDKKSDEGKHTMTYEIETDGPKADVTYMKKGMQISQKSGVESGWTADVKYDDDLDMLGANITAQLDGTGKVSCRIKVDGEVVAENDSEGDYVVVDCTAPTDF